MTQQEQIRDFLTGRAFAVAGASVDREKYGNKVLRSYLHSGHTVFAIHPRERQIEGVPGYPDLASLPEKVDGVSIVTRPEVTETILEQAAAAGIRNVWMQPGAEPADWLERARRLGLNAIGGGPCILVALRYRE
jgi:predicted CoA-binding protein